MEENKKQEVKQNDKSDYSGLITFVIIVILGIIIWNWLGKTSNNDTETTNGEPTNMEVMAYAQTVLDRELNNPSYSRDERDYNIVNNEGTLRYKIEGKVNSEKFWMIIQFTDNTYKEYDLISLQVGNQKY